jgi:light-regulated signal transduction histidine kinase (bacteriophytochrome)
VEKSSTDNNRHKGELKKEYCSLQQNQGSQLLAEITLKLRQSLQLEEILQTAVTEVRNLLQADRVLVYRLWPDGNGSVVTEAVVPGWPAILGQAFPAEVFPQEYHQLYCQGRIQATEDAEIGIAPCLVKFMNYLYP